MYRQFLWCDYIAVVIMYLLRSGHISRIYFSQLQPEQTMSHAVTGCDLILFTIFVTYYWCLWLLQPTITCRMSRERMLFCFCLYADQLTIFSGETVIYAILFLWNAKLNIHWTLLAICLPGDCTVVSGVVVVIVVGVCNHSQMRTSTCLIFGVSIGLEPG